MIRYRVGIPEPHRHLVSLRASFPPQRGAMELSMPAWSPGSYLLRDYARHVQSVRARDGRGRPLDIEKVGPSTWRVARAADGVRVDYEVYGFERTVRTSHVTADHAFLHGPTLFLFNERQRRRPCTVEVDLPTGWKFDCALPLRRGRLVAEDLDQLLDSPIECGQPTRIRFTVAGTPFRTVMCGPSDVPKPRVRRDFARIAKVQREIFGEFPFSDYLAIVNFTASSRGGLEHGASMAVEWPGTRFGDDRQYQDFLSLLSHELFHAWNVKASRPAAFYPFRYLEASPTRLLWWYEGVTDYYAYLALLRAGLIDANEYLRRLLGRWQQLLATPGRRLMSAADSSFDAWVKLYRPDENSVNSTVSYYLKGHLIGALLDLEIRQQTDGARTLDDVARLIYKRGRRGLPEDGVRRAVHDVLGADPGDWFERCVDGKGELPLPRALLNAGLVVRGKQEDATTGWMGAALEADHRRVRVVSVRADGPAAAAGLSATDELLAIDGVRGDLERLSARLGKRTPGSKVRLTVARGDRLREVDVKLGTRPDTLEIAPVAKPSEAQRQRLKEWLGVAPEELSAQVAGQEGATS